MNAPWIQTASGGAFPMFGATPDMVNFRDLAEGLAKEARFAGQTPGVFYSVAQHCVHACALVEPEARPYALLHDGHEGLGMRDFPSPFKAELRRATDLYDRACAAMDSAIHAAAGLDWPVPPAIKAQVDHADQVMQATEKRDFMVAGPVWTAVLPAPARMRLAPWPWARAADEFLALLETHCPGTRRAWSGD